MIRKIAVILISLTFLISYDIIDINTDIKINVSAKTLYVNETGSGGAYNSIQDAINASSEGDTVYVHSGTHYGRFTVNKTISLVGEDRDTTIINSSGIEDVINVTSNWVNITGFTIIGREVGAYNASIKLYNTQKCFISNNNISSIGRTGIYLVSSQNNTIDKNDINSHSFYGIRLSFSSYNILSNNTCNFNIIHGIRLRDSSYNKIKFNNGSHNNNGIFIYRNSNNNTIKNNFFDNNTGTSITGNGIWIENSNDNIVKNNYGWNNIRGISVFLSSSNNIIINNLFSNNSYGISITSESTFNTFLNNTCSYNNYGIYIEKFSNNNTIYHNNILFNSNQSFDEGDDNKWDNGYPSGGNYWSDWTSPDIMSGINQDVSGSDDIVDNPYVIDPDSRDNYPLTIQIEIPIPDGTSPLITNLHPINSSITNDNNIIISADYSDPSGINIGSVILNVDGIEVTSSATVTEGGVDYIPGTILSEGNHTVYLEVRDSFDNLATKTWIFTIDTIPPLITKLQPPNASITNDNSTLICVEYSDPSGINVSSVLLNVDGIDRTSIASVTFEDTNFIPESTFSEGDHTIYFEVRDNVNNLAAISWSFTVNTIAPDITPPKADAGPDKKILMGDTIVFNGNGSTDDRGIITNYSWLFYYNDLAIILYGVNPSFEFDIVDHYEVTLIVRDPSDNYATDTMWVNVSIDNSDNNEVEPFFVFCWVFLILVAIIIVIIIIILLTRRKREESEELETEIQNRNN